MSPPWRIVLFVSLALNLLIVGGAIGAVVAGARLERPDQSHEASAQPIGARAFMMLLPPDVRASVRDELVQTWAQSGDQREAVRAAREEAVAALAAEPYDPARVAAAFARMREADGRLTEAYHAAVAKALGELTPAQREAAAENLAHPVRERMRERRDQLREEGLLLTPEERARMTPEERQERRLELRERLRDRIQERREQRTAP